MVLFVRQLIQKLLNFLKYNSFFIIYLLFPVDSSIYVLLRLLKVAIFNSRIFEYILISYV